MSMHLTIATNPKPSYRRLASQGPHPFNNKINREHSRAVSQHQRHLPPAHRPPQLTTHTPHDHPTPPYITNTPCSHTQDHPASLNAPHKSGRTQSIDTYHFMHSLGPPYPPPTPTRPDHTHEAPTPLNFTSLIHHIPAI